MEKLVANRLLELEFADMQKFQNMAVLPLLLSGDRSPRYITLSEALADRLIRVTEVDWRGSVPELKVVNKADVPILMLDGEELRGAKQNRVLNTTILLKKKSETIIPVSCTEQGRWHYLSEEFEDSGVVLSPQVRAVKVRSVSDSLQECERFESDQSAVWNGVAKMCAEAGVQSPTLAARDVFESRAGDLASYLDAFPLVPKQKGLLVFVNGRVVGFDLLSLDSAYESLHGRLVKSYALEAILAQRVGRKVKPSSDSAKEFIKEAVSCGQRKHKSVGHGWDYRFRGKRIIGSALVYWKKVIHCAFFRTASADGSGWITDATRRRHFRIYEGGWEVF